MRSWQVTRGCLRIAQQPPHRLDHPPIELASRFAPELPERFGGRTLGPPVALGPVGPAKHHVVGVHHRHYARPERYLLSFEPIGVTASVWTLVVMPDDRDRPGKGLERLDHPRSYIRVAFYDFPLFGRKGTELLQDRVCHPELAHIVQESTVHEPLQFLFVQAQFPPDHPREAADLERVIGGVAVLGSCGIDQDGGDLASLFPSRRQLLWCSASGIEFVEIRHRSRPVLLDACILAYDPSPCFALVLTVSCRGEIRDHDTIAIYERAITYPVKAQASYLPSF